MRYFPTIRNSIAVGVWIIRISSDLNFLPVDDSVAIGIQEAVLSFAIRSDRISVSLGQRMVVDQDFSYVAVEIGAAIARNGATGSNYRPGPKTDCVASGCKLHGAVDTAGPLTRTGDNIVEMLIRDGSKGRTAAVTISAAEIVADLAVGLRICVPVVRADGPESLVSSWLR